LTSHARIALCAPAERSLIRPGVVNWEEIEFVLEDADRETDRPYMDGWETIRFEIEDDENEQAEV
jgi:hypothetical protein